MKQFKKGDKVVILRDYIEHRTGKEGEEGTFSAYNENTGIGHHKDFYPYIIRLTSSGAEYYVNDICLLEEDFKLPEKWYVKVTDESRTAIGTWRSGGSLKGVAMPGVCLSEYASMKGYWIPATWLKAKTLHHYKEYKEITFEQFKKYVLKQNDMETCEIIGYKCPTDLFDGADKAGTVFKTVSSTSIRMYKSDDAGPTQYSRHLPKEIVETWEPVYKRKTLEYNIGDWLYCEKDFHMDKSYGGRRTYTAGKWYVSEHKGAITDDEGSKEHYMNAQLVGEYFRKATETEQEERQAVEIAGYRAEKTAKGIKFGCQEFSIAELDCVRRIVGSSDLNAVVSIHGVRITTAIIGKLINLAI